MHSYSKVGRRMAKGKKKPIEQYEHLDKRRKNNPLAGLVTPDTDRDGEKKTYAYDPHLDPQLVWSGKAEHTSFEVPTVSLHVHERIDPHTIIEAVERRDGEVEMEQPALFETPEENLPLRQAIDFYQHEHSWTNRMVAGDSLLVMNSLLEKEGLAGQNPISIGTSCPLIVTQQGSNPAYPRSCRGPSTWYLTAVITKCTQRTSSRMRR
jgi:adenine-specific DNA-methyltransferase